MHVKIRARLICVYGKQSCPGIPMPGMWDFTGTVFLLGAYMEICSKMNMGYIEYVSKGVSKKVGNALMLQLFYMAAMHRQGIP